MDIQALIQEKIKSKELSKAVKAGNKKTSIPLNKITDPSALGSGAIASIMDSGDNKSVVDALVNDFIDHRDSGKTLATDQLLNALFIVTKGRISAEDELIAKRLLNDLGQVEEDE